VRLPHDKLSLDRASRLRRKIAPAADPDITEGKLQDAPQGVQGPRTSMSAEKRAARSGRQPAMPSERAQPDGANAPFGYVLEEQYGFLLRRAQQRYLPLFQEMMGPGGPTPTQFAALCRLAGGAEISQNHLGRLTAMDPATIKGVIGRLAERGLVERLPDPNDQRRLLIRLTAAGHAAMPDLFARAKAITIAALEPLSPEEAKTIVALLTRMS